MPGPLVAQGLRTVLTKLGSRGAKKRATQADVVDYVRGLRGSRKSQRGPEGKPPRSPNKSSSRNPNRSNSRRPNRRKKKRDIDIDIDAYGGGPGGFFREFLSNLFDVDLSLSQPNGPLGVVGGAMGKGAAGENVNMGKPAPQFNVTAQVAKRYNNPTLQVISNQISDIITSMSVINSQLKNQTEFQRFQYNSGLQTQREGMIESDTPTLLAANDNAPTSMLGTAGLVAAITRITDQLTDLSDKLDEMEGGMGGAGGAGGGGMPAVDVDIDGKRKGGWRDTLKRWGGKVSSAYNKLPSWVRKGVGGAGKLARGLGGLPGLVAAIVAEPIAEYLGKDTFAGAAVSTVGTTATYAGMGRLAGMGIGAGIGALFGGVGAVPGAVVGGAIGTGLGAMYGLYEGITNNWNALTGGGAQPGVGMTGSASEAMNFFQSRGWSKAQAAGIVGNLQGESGPNLNPGAVGDGGDAYGIAQWNQRVSPDRVNNFQRVIGVPLRQSNFQQQLQFVDWELRNTERRAGSQLAAAQDPAQAAVAMSAYERYQGWDQGTASAETQRRIANARSLFGGQTASSDGGGTPPLRPPPAGERGRTNYTEARRSELLGQVNSIQSGRGPTVFTAQGAAGTRYRARLIPTKSTIDGKTIDGNRYVLEMQESGRGPWKYAADYDYSDNGIQQLMNAVEGMTLRNPAARRVQAPTPARTQPAAPPAQPPATPPRPAEPRRDEVSRGEILRRESEEQQLMENAQKFTVEVAQAGSPGRPMAGSTQPTGTMGNAPPDDPRSSVLDDIMPLLRYGGM